MLFHDTIKQVGMVLLRTRTTSSHCRSHCSWMSSSAPWTISAWLGSLPLWVKPALAQSYFLSKHITIHMFYWHLQPLLPNRYLIDNHFNDVRKFPSSTWWTLPPFLLHMQKAFWDCNSLLPFFKHSLIKEHILWLLYVFNWNRKQLNKSIQGH